MITYFSKINCNHCEFMFQKFCKKFKEQQYEKITIQNDEDALEITKKHNVRTVPFLVINENVVLSTSDLIKLLNAIN